MIGHLPAIYASARRSSGGGPPAIPAPDLWFKFDETTGLAVANSGSLGSSYDGTITPYIGRGTGNPGSSYVWLGSGESWGSGGVTGGLDIDNTYDDRYAVRLNTPLNLDNVTQLTISYWTLRQQQSETNATVFFHGAAWNNNMLTTRCTNTTRAITSINNTTIQPDADPGDFPVNVKTHHTWVMDFGAAKVMSLYRDGAATPTEYTVTGTELTPIASSETSLFSLGWQDSGAVARYFYHGAICDFRVWVGVAADQTMRDAIYANS